MSTPSPYTPYHAKYFAHDLTRQGGAGIDRLTRSLFDACVDLNPHQIEAALFALRSPLSKGVLLADEVGLGKTIEAGLVLCQFWAENKRRLLVICPASIRKQWSIELLEKFNLPSIVLESKLYRDLVRQGNPQPFESKSIVIISTHFASRYCDEIKAVGWDLVAIDEAHKLRNCYRQSNRMGQNIRWALEDRRKLLLTATPLQNSLLELYGLSTLIDEHAFGDLPSFRSQFTGVGGNLAELRDRLNGFCNRTLRKQVLEYIKYTGRSLVTQSFTPTEQENHLYDLVSAYLQREGTYAFPDSQRHLTVLILRKLLASSSQAIAGTLEAIRDRLAKLLKGVKERQSLLEHLVEGDELEDELLDEILDGEETDEEGTEDEDEPEIDMAKLAAEIDELDRYSQLARSITLDAKTRSLTTALGIGFAQMEKNGAAPKAVIFTESRRTQMYLKDFLEANGYAGKTITFSGTNNDPDSKRIYEQWLDQNRDTGKASGSRAVDTRTALIEHFENEGSILIATEAGAEGINLQFCSLVVNYDLPWNPQRIEQRIGRCHRYGQKFDVVVVNFINSCNAADQRVHELLSEKFNLFSGVFGASDEVLGTIESGLDFEKRILAIYQNCRTVEEIEAAFSQLQEEMDEQIQSRMAETRQVLLEHFDEDVHTRLRCNLEGTMEQLDNVGKQFWNVTHFALDGDAEFDDSALSFDLHRPPREDIRRGRYHLISKDGQNVLGEFLYRISHPLGEHVISSAKNAETPAAVVTFDITNHPTKISLVEELKGKGGWLTLQLLVVDSFEREEYLLFSGMDDSGQSISQETLEKLFNCSATCASVECQSSTAQERLVAEGQRIVQATINRSLEENNRFFNEERERLEKWAEDMEVAATKELRDTKEQIKTLSRQSRQAETIDEQHGFQEKIRAAEQKKRRLRQRIFDVEDEIAEKRDVLIESLERRMKQRSEVSTLFTIQWKVE